MGTTLRDGFQRNLNRETSLESLVMKVVQARTKSTSKLRKFDPQAHYRGRSLMSEIFVDFYVMMAHRENLLTEEHTARYTVDERQAPR